MKLNKVLAIGAAVASASSVFAADLIDYSSVSGGDIDFLGNGTFDFTPSTGSFQVTGSSVGTGANGFIGAMTGVYTIGTISGTTATVSGTGGFSITDSSSVKLTGSLTWNTISETGAVGGVNYLASVNLTGISYSGTNPELEALDALAGHQGVDVLTFQFASDETLSQLASTSLATSFSGSINPVATTPDGGTTVALLGGAFAALGLARAKFGKK